MLFKLSKGLGRSRVMCEEDHNGCLASPSIKMGRVAAQVIRFDSLLKANYIKMIKSSKIRSASPSALPLENITKM